jgi:hypothetical protein
MELFHVDRLPSYSTIRRSLLFVDYEEYSVRLAQFFNITPKPGETIGLDGKVLRGSYLLEVDNPSCQPHPAIVLVSAYLVERGLILKPHQVDYQMAIAGNLAINLYRDAGFKIIY